MSRMRSALLISALLFGVAFAPHASASRLNDTMVLTVRNGPVAVPGVVLQPGKYDLRFADLEHDSVSITTANGRSLGFFQVIPVSRHHHLGRPAVRLSEAHKQAPPEIRSFFYPGQRTGYEFLDAPQPEQLAHLSSRQTTVFPKRGDLCSST
jgi:hypothetical protein